ncbi:MAG TPA: hypothetical protein VNM92_17150 [Thermoanaerobaculia bacterium]|nr:hypothetical protein [Thermoanaerobaculia bacterium]
MSRKFKFVFFALAIALSTNAYAQCRVEYYNIGGYWGDLERDMSDYGVIFDDAKDFNCSGAAALALHSKIYNTRLARGNTAYNQFLEGTHVSLMFAAAQMISANGDLHSWLDNILIEVESGYAPALQTGCGFSGTDWESGNTCVDDYAIMANAHAWIAAYQFKRGRPHQTRVSYAVGALAQTFSPDNVCINNPQLPMSASNRGPCNSTNAADLNNGSEIISLNHGFQNITYGIGLMTSVSGALIGLQEANAYTGLTDDQKTVARALLREAQANTVSDYAFGTNCSSFTNINGQVSRNYGVDCGDPGFFYKPSMFKVDVFYSQFVGVNTNNGQGYPFSYFEEGWFTDNFAAYQFAGPNQFPRAFFHAGRRATYKEFGYLWLTNRPLLLGVPDFNDPIGWIDTIDQQGIAHGWTCDRDVPMQSLQVQLSDAVSEIFAVGYASLGSEPAVNNECGGGWAHRFQIQLPSYSRGRSIYAYGVDATGKGLTTLSSGCAQAPSCSW